MRKIDSKKCLGGFVDFFEDEGKIVAQINGRPVTVQGLRFLDDFPLEQLQMVNVTLNTLELYPPVNAGWSDRQHSGVANKKMGLVDEGTFHWAQQLGFAIKQAELIAVSSANVDIEQDPTDITDNPKQSWHFNVNDTHPDIHDFRIEHAIAKLKRAVEIQRKSGAAFNPEALELLGEGLHALQDMLAHVNELITRYHVTDPVLKFKLPECFYGHANSRGDYADDPYHCEDPSKNGDFNVSPIAEEAQQGFNERYSMTKTATYLYLITFLSMVAPDRIPEDIYRKLRERLIASDNSKSMSILTGFIKELSKMFENPDYTPTEKSLSVLVDAYSRGDASRPDPEEREITNATQLLGVLKEALAYELRHPEYDKSEMISLSKILGQHIVCLDRPENKLPTNRQITAVDRVGLLHLTANAKAEFNVTWLINGIDAIGKDDFIGIFPHDVTEYKRSNALGWINVSGEKYAHNKSIPRCTFAGKPCYAVYFTKNPDSGNYQRLMSVPMEQHNDRFLRLGVHERKGTDVVLACSWHGAVGNQDKLVISNNSDARRKKGVFAKDLVSESHSHRGGCTHQVRLNGQGSAAFYARFFSPANPDGASSSSGKPFSCETVSVTVNP